MHRKLALNLEDLSVESLDVVFEPEVTAYAGSIIIRTNTDPVSGDCSRPTICCA
ncbi:hypothetical protein [Longimicrobium sp.]|uniref:hypothetical protein n=1 Tax=Longimicrobium sp. TaxID=2029185 RepID=UPI003B3B3BEC